MARSRTTFGKLICKGCTHKLHLTGICQRKDCGCIYPLDQKPDAKTDALQMQIINDSTIAAMNGRYIPKVKVAQPKIKHESRRNPKKKVTGKPLTGKNCQLVRVKHKSTLGKAALGKSGKLFKGRRILA